MWRGAFDRACQDYAEVARAIAQFDPVLIVCNPGASQQVKDYCGSAVSITELPLDDSWLRDTGPIIVSDGHGHREAVHFGFNGWGGKFEHTLDAAVGALIGASLGFEVHAAPLVAEGGALFVDGQGTLITTKGAVLNDNRNPGLTAADA